MLKQGQHDKNATICETICDKTMTSTKILQDKDCPLLNFAVEQGKHAPAVPLGAKCKNALHLAKLNIYGEKCIEESTARAALLM